MFESVQHAKLAVNSTCQSTRLSLVRTELNRTNRAWHQWQRIPVIEPHHCGLCGAGSVLDIVVYVHHRYRSRFSLRGGPGHGLKGHGSGGRVQSAAPHWKVQLISPVCIYPGNTNGRHSQNAIQSTELSLCTVVFQKWVLLFSPVCIRSNQITVQPTQPQETVNECFTVYAF